MSCSSTIEVGAYVLGALDPAERSALERHLPTCAECQRAVAELAGLPGLLSRLTPEEAADVSPVPARLLDGMLRKAAHRRTTRLRVVGVAAGVAVLAALGVGIGVAATHDGPHRTTLSASSGGVQARATLTEVSGGTTIALSLQGVPPGERCKLVAVTTDGQQLDAGSWYATYQGHAGVTETAAAEPDEIKALVVETLDGRQLVSIPVSS